jgi:hypothetical protein
MAPRTTGLPATRAGPDDAHAGPRRWVSIPGGSFCTCCTQGGMIRS